MTRSKILRAARDTTSARIEEWSDPDLGHMYGGRVDVKRLRAQRLEAVRRELAQRDLAGAVLFDPVNIRYATGTRNMAVWTLHNPARYAFVATNGPVILFDYHGAVGPVETIDEVRPAILWFYFASGYRTDEFARKWAVEIADLIHRHGGGNRRLAVDSLQPEGQAALANLGISVCNGEEVLERARSIKGPEECTAIRVAVEAAESGIAAMWEGLEPGITENELWAELHRANIQAGGEWIETRLLASGPRTNPWLQECSSRPVESGDLVAFDTDLIGPFGYCADISRAWVAGAPPSPRQRELHTLATEQIEHNTELLRPGKTFREVAEQAWPIPDVFRVQRYPVIAHGVGMCDEWPSIFHLEDHERVGYDGVLEPDMVLSVESYIGAVGETEGVKLEEQVLITHEGPVMLSTYPKSL